MGNNYIYQIGNDYYDSIDEYGEDGEYRRISGTVVYDGVNYYPLTDSVCCALAVFKKKTKYCLMTVKQYLGFGYARYFCKGEPFVYDNLVVLYPDFSLNKDSGYVCVQQNGKWGILAVSQKPFVQFKPKLVVPVKYNNWMEAVRAAKIDIGKYNEIQVADDEFRPDD